jgi:hypothetical protein
MNRLGLILCCDFLMLNHGYDSRLWGASANAPRQTLPGRVLGGEMTLGDTQPKGIAIDAYATDAGEHLERCRAAGRLPDHLLGAKAGEKSVGHWKG